MANKQIMQSKVNSLQSGRQNGFTLAELLAVMLIIVILTGMAVGSFYGMGRGARLRGAVSSFHAALSLTRQYAITRGEPLRVQLFQDDDDGNVYGYRILHEDGTQIRPTQYLPPAMEFDDLPEMTFLPDGGLKDGNVTINIKDETGTGSKVTFTINGLTGMVTVTGD